METVRTTINLPKIIIQKTKHRAVEYNLTLGESIAEALNLWLSVGHETPPSPAVTIKKISGAVRLGITENPAKIKKMLENRYEKEMLS